MAEYVKKMHLSDEEKFNRVIELKTLYYKTDFVFLKKHVGYRKNKIHIFMGMPGGGKSTLRNSLIIDFLKCNPGKNVFLYLSEESGDDFKNDTARTLDYKIFNDRVFYFSEQDLLSDGINPSQDEFLETLTIDIRRVKADIMFFDNLTTSKVYGGEFKDQEKAIGNLKPKLQTLDIPSVFFTHTGKSVKRGHRDLIDSNETRGTSTLTNIAEFFYVMQTFKNEKVIDTTIRVDKHRGYTIREPYHSLAYDEKQKLYTHDKGVSFEYINELHKQQDRLGKSTFQSKNDRGSKSENSSWSDNRGKQNSNSKRQSDWWN